MHTNTRTIPHFFPTPLLVLTLLLLLTLPLAPLQPEARCDDTAATPAVALAPTSASAPTPAATPAHAAASASSPAATPAASAPDASAPANPFDAYKTKISNAIKLNHPPGEQTFASEILQGYRFPLRLLDDASFDAQLARWKKHDLSFIARTLALEKPTEAMDAAFAQFRAMCETAVAEVIGEIRIFYFADIKAAHALGVTPNGVDYVPQTDSVSISNYITAERAGGARVRVLPILLMQIAPDATDEKMRLFNGRLRDMRWKLDEAIYNAYCGKLYEIARPAIVSAVDKSRFPLWLIDGMTNAIPLTVMRSHNPTLDFEQLLQTHSPRPADLAGHAARINLDTWIGSRTAATPKPETDAYTYLAMLVVLDAIGQNGEDWIPELFKRLREENSPALNMATIYTIYSEITDGKDLRDNIANVKNSIAEK
ncbi:MAG: hypothetical protein LBM04_04840 [Opitutaceae bacterium]|jgi:hypothetical protein|nr:hypothetical protein [Opitutaceae bacterium]